MRGFQLALFLVLPNLQEMQVKATETSSTHLEWRWRKKEADMFARKEVWKTRKIRTGDAVHLDNSSSLKEMVFHEVETERNDITERKRNNREKTRKSQKKTTREKS